MEIASRSHGHFHGLVAKKEVPAEKHEWTPVAVFAVVVLILAARAVFALQSLA